jgi:outer membrane lipoprotein SlyB
MKRIATGAALLATVLLVSACASSHSPNVYSRHQARTEQSVRLGTVEGVRTVLIEGTRTPIGAAAGATIGGIAGGNIGEGRTSTVWGILGAVGGGIAGAAAEQAITRKQGQEITVRLDNGNLIAIVQEADEHLKPGERVRVLSGGGVSRVTR